MKEFAKVAENLQSNYNEHGPPEILQSDQGSEFKGVVKTLCEALSVSIIRSSAYSPQTQGKMSTLIIHGRKSTMQLRIMKSSTG